MQQDPMQAFYQTLCVGMEEWDDILSYPDEFIPEEDFDTDDFIPPESEKVDEMEQQPADEASGNRKGKRPRLPLAEQVSFLVIAQLTLNIIYAYMNLFYVT